MQIIRKCTSLILILALAISLSLPAFAYNSDSEPETVTFNGVVYQLIENPSKGDYSNPDRSYTVMVPKNLVINGVTGEGEYTIKVKGSVIDDQYVYVAPREETIPLQNLNRGTSLPAKVHQDNKIISGKDIEEDFSDKATIPGSIKVENLTAGTWAGELIFDINLVSKVSDQEIVEDKNLTNIKIFEVKDINIVTDSDFNAGEFITGELLRDSIVLGYSSDGEYYTETREFLIDKIDTPVSADTGSSGAREAYWLPVDISYEGMSVKGVIVPVYVFSSQEQVEEEPVESEVPEVQEEPEITEDLETVETPEPAEPEIPVEPEIVLPEDAEIYEPVETPEEIIEPVEPVIPEVPEEEALPEQPSDQEEPEVPEVPVEPEVPVISETPKHEIYAEGDSRSFDMEWEDDIYTYLDDAAIRSMLTVTDENDCMLTDYEYRILDVTTSFDGNSDVEYTLLVEVEHENAFAVAVLTALGTYRKELRVSVISDLERIESYVKEEELRNILNVEYSRDGANFESVSDYTIENISEPSLVLEENGDNYIKRAYLVLANVSYDGMSVPVEIFFDEYFGIYMVDEGRIIENPLTEEDVREMFEASYYAPGMNEPEKVEYEIEEISEPFIIGNFMYSTVTVRYKDLKIPVEIKLHEIVEESGDLEPEESQILDELCE